MELLSTITRKKIKSCCCIFSVRTGALIILWLYLLMDVLIVGVWQLRDENVSIYVGNNSVTVVNTWSSWNYNFEKYYFYSDCFVEIITSASGLVGIYTDQPKLLLGYFFYKIYYIFYAAISLVAGFLQIKYDRHFSFRPAFKVVFLIVYYIGLQIYFVRVIRQCYKDIKEIVKNRYTSALIVNHISVPPAVPLQYQVHSANNAPQYPIPVQMMQPAPPYHEIPHGYNSQQI